MRNTQDDNNLNTNPNSTKQNTPFLKVIDNSLRFLVIPLSIATIWLTMTNHQDNTLYGKLKFTDLMGLKYMIYISFISAVYALFAGLSTWIKSLANKAWIFFVSDQIIAYLMVTSGAAVIEIMYLAYNGDNSISWSETCSSYGRFCGRIKLAFIFHALALCCFIVLALISAFRAFVIFEPPFVPNKELEESTS